MNIRLTLALCAFTLATGAAQASTKISIDYLQPSGTVNTDTPIEVWVKVSADRAIGNELGAPFGFEPDELPTFAWVTDGFGSPTIDAFAEYTGLQISRGYRCSTSCDVPGYTFSAALNPPDGYLSWLGDTLRTGTFLLGTYTPDGSHATGNIAFSVVPTLAFRVYGTSLSGENLVASIGPTGGFAPCEGFADASCGFTRNVSAVPEASALSMLLLGAGTLVAGRLARRSR